MSLGVDLCVFSDSVEYFVVLELGLGDGVELDGGLACELGVEL